MLPDFRLHRGGKRMGTDFSNELYDLHHGNVSEMYSKWPAPDLIVSDGAYGVRGFRGDTTDAAGLGNSASFAACNRLGICPTCYLG